MASGAWAGPGEHIRVGDYTTIAPELETGVEFRSNAYLSVGAVQSLSPRDQAISAFNFLLIPRLGIHVDHPKVRFDLDGSYELRKFFDRDLADNLDRFTDFTGSMRLEAFPKGVVGFRIQDSAVLRNRSSDNPFAGVSLLSQLRNDLQGFFTVRPGPDLSIDAGLGWSWHNYKVPGADVQRDLNTRSTIQPMLNLNWRFLPSTALVFEGSYEANHWRTNWIPTQETIGVADGGAVRSYGEYLAVPDSEVVKVSAGVRGRISRRFVIALMAGWGAGRFDVESVNEESAADPGIGDEADPAASGFDANVEGVDGLLVLARGQFDLHYRENLRKFGAQFSVMYRKDFQSSFFTNYVTQNHLRADVDVRLFRYLTLSLGGGPRFEEYVGEVARRDIYMQLDYAVGVEPVKWFDVSLGGSWVQRASSQREVQYDNVLAHLLFRFSY